ncbi:MAG: hypothetical protein QF732_01595 [Nitrospinaceae bacterium]|nr:hypothetical protein [Nitrospinaceae bacterium]
MTILSQCHVRIYTILCLVEEIGKGGQTHRAIRQERVAMGEYWGGDVTCMPNALRPGVVLYIVEVFRISALVSYTRTRTDFS